MKTDAELNNKKKNVNVFGSKKTGKAALSKSPNMENNLEMTKNDFRSQDELRDVGVIRECLEFEIKHVRFSFQDRLSPDPMEKEIETAWSRIKTLQIKFEIDPIAAFLFFIGLATRLYRLEDPR